MSYNRSSSRSCNCENGGEWEQGVWNKGAEGMDGMKYTELKEHLDSSIQMPGISLIPFTAYQSTT